MSDLRTEGYLGEYDCLGNTAAGEPVFVVRAQDKLAPVVVRLWADLAEMHGCDSGKICSARDIADNMEAWEPRKFPD